MIKAAWEHELRGHEGEWVSGGPHIPEGMDTPNMRLAEQAGLIAADTRLSPPDRLISTTDPDEARETGAMLDIDSPIDQANLDRPDVGRGVPAEKKRKRKKGGRRAFPGAMAPYASSKSKRPELTGEHAGDVYRRPIPPGLDQAAGMGGRSVTDTAAAQQQAEGPDTWREADTEQMEDSDIDKGYMMRGGLADEVRNMPAQRKTMAPPQHTRPSWEAIGASDSAHGALLDAMHGHMNKVMGWHTNQRQTAGAHMAPGHAADSPANSPDMGNGRHPVTGQFTQASNGLATGHPGTRDAGTLDENGGDPGYRDTHLVNSTTDPRPLASLSTTECAPHSSSYRHNPGHADVAVMDQAGMASPYMRQQLGSRAPSGTPGQPPFHTAPSGTNSGPRRGDAFDNMPSGIGKMWAPGIEYQNTPIGFGARDNTVPQVAAYGAQYSCHEVGRR